jgi:hypothetical protein
MSNNTFTWRELMPIHPAAELFPIMTDAELVILGESIKKIGLLHSLVIYTDADEKESWLDCRNRFTAMERVGLKVEIIRDEHGDLSLHGVHVVADPAFIYLGKSVDPYAYVWAVNDHRRHVTAEQKRDAIAKTIKAQPGKTDRQIAKVTGASPTTVGTVRKKLEEAGDVSKLDTRTDSKGRQQPARKSRKKPEKPKPPAKPVVEPTPASQPGQQEISGEERKQQYAADEQHNDQGEPPPESDHPEQESNAAGVVDLRPPPDIAFRIEQGSLISEIWKRGNTLDRDAVRREVLYEYFHQEHLSSDLHYRLGAPERRLHILANLLAQEKPEFVYRVVNHTGVNLDTLYKRLTQRAEMLRRQSERRLARERKKGAAQESGTAS